ncbi:MAG TPA: hypothetical protein DIU39_07340 [Flavobacteriales bacterium]|nr:hypothetical protein [Flavobacteriales bacterium]|tara:strand:- start:56686 stop:56928 length:243 start_codon:yes stop_codon:yes gene_type:complete
MTDKIQFPQYRKNAQGTSYFKILSKDAFIEIQIIGNKLWEHKVEARQYPEKLLIQDMLLCKDHLWQTIPESEFNKIAENK